MNVWDIKREAAIVFWQEKVKACRSSGMNVREWCAENHISHQTYYTWEKRCLSAVNPQSMKSEAEVAQGNTLIKVIPDALPVASNKDTQDSTISTAPAELVIRCGCVSMDISSEMPVARIAELVAALNKHV